VVRSRAHLDALMKLHPYARMLATAALAIVVCGAPNGHNPVSGPFLPQDCAAATQNLLLQAAALGLGTCWCGVYPQKARMDAVRVALGLPEQLQPFNIIAVGVPAEEPPQRGHYDEKKIHLR
jgi:nitroreductase